MSLLKFILSQLDLPEPGVKNTIELLSNGATIPFIARYRKEQTENMNEVEIEQISDFIKLYEELESRKKSILKAITEQGALTEELESKINGAATIVELEDLYVPYKKKRKTKADVARDAGLEPLAKILMAQNINGIIATGKFLNESITSEDEAFQGAKNIIAEWINEDRKARVQLRRLYTRTAKIVAKVVKAEKDKPASQKFCQYFEWNEPLKTIPSHRFLAINRAQKEGILRLKIEVEKEEAIKILSHQFVKKTKNSCTAYIKETIDDAYARLFKPSFSTEFLTEAKKKADKEAINVFAENLEQLLLSSPLGGKRILALDPGFKSGCKVVCIDENGNLLDNATIFPHPPQNESSIASRKIVSMVNTHKVEAVSIGNGTASRETEEFIKGISFNNEIPRYVVNEAGASVYSASKLAREEFPNYDITVRGAVSIGRRLQDPLAELVKIDPKSIGVGQYQHEVDQILLKDKLDAVVGSCVNRIGVNVNTASRELLSHVSGIGPSLAENIIDFRKKNGRIKNRQELLHVPRLGAKAFEQAAGFLRIKDGEHPLDDSAVHPERYEVVENLAEDQNLEIKALIGNKNILNKLSLEKYAGPNVGILTLKDIVKELEKPGIDPRQPIKTFEFDPLIKSIDDLKIGMTLPGIVNNITNFGCFVDIGIKESGLIHISKLKKGFVSDVHSVVKLNQHVIVKLLDVSIDSKRIQLSLENE